MKKEILLLTFVIFILLSSATISVVTSNVKCWGYNLYGQLGDGTNIDSLTPVNVEGIEDAIAITAGYGHNCAILPGGNVKCWGLNQHGELGDGTYIDSSTPVNVEGIAFAAITAGLYHTCAILPGGRAQCWGFNRYGQVGYGRRTDPTSVKGMGTPVNVAGIEDAIAITAGFYHSCAILSGGNVKCWGQNLYGELGNGKTSYPYEGEPVPVNVIGIWDAIAITAGHSHSCALLSGGNVKCWGFNRFGQLGAGTTDPSYVPVNVKGIEDAIAITAGTYHNCALLFDGTVKCWGYNLHGQLGDGTTRDSSVPVIVEGIDNPIAIIAGYAYNCAFLSVGSAKCWGYNLHGQLGDGTTTNSVTPVIVEGIEDAIAIEAGNHHSCALIGFSDGESCTMDTQCTSGNCDNDYCCPNGECWSGTSCGSCCMPSDEICNGVDDDCDGIVDNIQDLNTKQEGECAGSFKKCDVDGVAVDDYSYIQTYEAIEITCDGLDNDCDGLIDNIQDLNTNQEGECAGSFKKCVDGNAINDYSLVLDYESVETKCIDTLDNDCDGLVDDLDSDCAVTPTACEDCGFGCISTDCHTIGECYWIDTGLPGFGGDCYDIADATLCSDFDDDKFVCNDNALHQLGCIYNDDDNVCEESPILCGNEIPGETDSVTGVIEDCLTCQEDSGCIDDFPYCQSDGSCGSTPYTDNCVNDGICESGETCGCSDCYGEYAGCRSGFICGGEGEGCVDEGIIDYGDYKCVGLGGVDCPSNNVYTNEPQFCVSIWNNGLPYVQTTPVSDTDTCCLTGECGTTSTDASGTVTLLTKGNCVDGDMLVEIKDENGIVIDQITKPCVVPKKLRLPFYNTTSIIITLIIITGFYLRFNKKD